MWLHTDINIPIPRRNHSIMWIKGSGIQWVHICINQESRVRPTTSRTNRKLLINKKLNNRWVPPIQTHIRLVESQMKTRCIFISIWWAGGKMRWKEAYRSSYTIHQKHYPVDFDCTSGLYCGIKLDWRYDHTRSIDLSIPKYVPNALH